MDLQQTYCIAQLILSDQRSQSWNGCGCWNRLPKIIRSDSLFRGISIGRQLKADYLSSKTTHVAQGMLILPAVNLLSILSSRRDNSTQTNSVPTNSKGIPLASAKPTNFKEFSGDAFSTP